MKNRIRSIVVLIGIALTVSAQAQVRMPKPVLDALPGVPPQTQEWWGKAAAEQKVQGEQAQAADVESNFYTGKPYDAEIGGYVFKYRNYSPETQRWTTADPSGFPDGANNRIYVLTPIIQFDPLGLSTITNVSGNSLSSTAIIINVETQPQIINNGQNAEMVISWEIPFGLSGYIVQYVSMLAEAYDSSNNLVSSFSKTYYEAFKVTNGNLNGVGDRFLGSIIGANTYGSCTILGFATFLLDGNLNWTPDVPEANGLPSTEQMPSWWNLGAASATHSLTFSWIE